MTTLARTYLPLLLISALVSGCFGSAPPVPRDHYYRLVLPGPDASARVQESFPGVIAVEPLEADGLLHERPLLFSDDAMALRVQQHDYHYWTDTPPRMLQDQIVTYLRNSGISRIVVTPEMRVQPDYLVTGKAKRLERLIAGGRPRVVVSLDLTLVRLADSRLVLSDSFSEEAVAADGSVEASVAALNQATARILDRFVARAVGEAVSRTRKP